MSTRFGHRTILVTPLYREGQPFGAILIRRQEVRPFSEREIGLLKTFGDQAAIALENVRLFNETKEALDQQRASGEVLAAISSSIADTTPVFEKILASCEQLFAGKLAGITLVGQDGLIHVGAYHGAGVEEFEKIFPTPVDENDRSGAAIAPASGLALSPTSIMVDGPASARRGCQAVGIKAVVLAPMIWEDKGIGAIFVGRETTPVRSPTRTLRCCRPLPIRP